MTKEDREYAGQLKRFIRTQTTLLVTKEIEEQHVEQEIAAKLAQVKASRAYLRALRAETGAEFRILILARIQGQLAKVLADDAK